MIWNGVDLENFKPMGRIDARKALNLSVSRPIILLGASRLGSVLKGYDELLDALMNLRVHEEFDVVRFGHVSMESKKYKWVRDFGYVDDRRILNAIYSAADIFLAPSPQEAFGKTVVESLASGTPVVVFEGSGSAEIIVHNECGKVVERDDFREFAANALEFMKFSRNRELIRSNCVHRSAGFSDQKSALSYIDLYKAILRQLSS